MRAKARSMAGHMHIQPHSHRWGQLVFSSSGAVRVHTQGQAEGQAEGQGRASGHAFTLPPGRAVWIPPGVVHAVSAIEQAELRTVYIHAPLLPWGHCRVMEVTPLLQALVVALVAGADALPAPGPDAERERGLTALVRDELLRAHPLPLGLALPQEPRLRRLCEALLDDPLRHPDLAGWAREAGASERTLSRLFRAELGTGFREWRQQLLLAHGLTLAARGKPMGVIAAELGYSSASAFSAMVTRAVGMPPKRFFAQA
jgi:AraC-like DNA-binding protein